MYWERGMLDNGTIVMDVLKCNYWEYMLQCMDVVRARNKQITEKEIVVICHAKTLTQNEMIGKRQAAQRQPSIANARVS